MRIAVAGTHRVGKTTLAEAFAEAKPKYHFEPEPYVALVNEWGEEFADDASFESFERQLTYHGSRVAALAGEHDVVFDRCAADLLAYMIVAGRRSGDGELPEDVITLAQQALAGIELIVHLPLRSSRGFVADAGDASYRRAVDRQLAGILEDDQLGLLSSGSAPRVVALGGSTARRLERLRAYVEQCERGMGPLF